MDEICHRKGVEHALDRICDSVHFVAVGIYRWLYGWWTSRLHILLVVAIIVVVIQVIQGRR